MSNALPVAAHSPLPGTLIPSSSTLLLRHPPTIHPPRAWQRPPRVASSEDALFPSFPQPRRQQDKFTSIWCRVFLLFAFCSFVLTVSAMAHQLPDAPGERHFRERCSVEPPWVGTPHHLRACWSTVCVSGVNVLVIRDVFEHFPAHRCINSEAALHAHESGEAAQQGFLHDRLEDVAPELEPGHGNAIAQTSCTTLSTPPPLWIPSRAQKCDSATIST